MKKERIHVLLVEDEEAHAELIRRAFESEDVINLTVASSLEEARASLAEEIPDLAIIDLFLPDGRGLELLDDDEEHDYPVVIMTSHGDEEVAVEAMKAGALQYVVKSEIALAELPHKVETALRQWGHIVERKQAEEAVKASEEHFRSLIENALDIITVVDADANIRYASPSVERVLGYSPEEKTGTNLLALVHDEDQGEVARMVKQAFTEPGTTTHLVYRLRHQDGTWRFLEAVASSYVHSTGDRRGVINSRDITDRQRAEEERRELEGRLRQSQKWEIVASLSRDIAREFSNMLTPILEHAAMALQETSPESKTHAKLERVLAAANQARQMAEQIFVFSRRVAPRAKAVDLAEIVAREVERLRPTLPKTIELVRSLDEGCDPVMADPEQIREALANLCSNSIYAMRDTGGVLTVGLEMLPPGGDGTRSARLTVQDTGHGMDQATVERALEPFFTTKGSSGATGLGLSVAHAIVASHGGELTVTSEPDKGTTVHVDLPCA